ncbi:bifunctional phosphopantothenoylcysteine decarboxylase/phosphopantothenate--cysteine ligase CoaBC [Methylogaea oryzae]|uniref:Coenzyme A biosynthesis bifunctional protein CoaBC n=1 Tax=Methylogaea oryzae TaxID=1295382 RepID=A0A8D4VKM7_9GAMM|nr:bifunctional phosphopantothenoylcysteine decarboxylase/phosphopantothenate--cysteine ligase CoaBC [Methylogaea oryzae]BBL69573.1 phosphopantothenoylcysteine decarboxylase [Methylogaea oryzae]
MADTASLQGKHILLGVTGGVAAYKAAELARQLKGAGSDVRVVMSRGAAAFIAPLTFQALTGQPVAMDLLDAGQESAMGHIDLARWADAVVIAPATAHCLAKLRAGLADDLLSTLCLATEAPILLAPAMNRAMWANPATAENVDVLRKRGLRFIGPEAGEQACGEVGLGRMSEPAAVVEALAGLFRPGCLAGLSVLVSAGPTREAIDPVRFLSNRSSGKMGYAVARAAAAAGARVTLVSGPTALSPPAVAEFVAVESAADMYQAVMARAASHDIYIGTAAVADYAPEYAAAGKIKKTAGELTLTLRKTRDILAAVAALPDKPYTVGFAAETDDLEGYARAKLAAKNLDMVAANWVGEGKAFEQDDNALEVFWPGGRRTLPTASKAVLAGRLIDLIAERYGARAAV